MTRPRLAFVLQNALGWGTYAHQMRGYLETRDDFAILVHPVEKDRRAGFLNKRNNMGAVDKLLRRRDPIDGFAGARGAPIRAALERFRPDAVHFAGHWPAACMEGLAIPFSVTLDNTREGIERDLPRGAWSRRDMDREAALLRRAALVYPMSTWAADSVIADCGCDAGRIHVMPPSVNVARFCPPERSKAADGPLRIVFIGNDFRRKGGERLVQWVAGPLAGKAELHIVSGDPQAQAARGAPGVEFHGRVPNAELVARLLPKMDVLCLPTRSDMSPQVLAEAAAASLATVASRIGGIADLVADGHSGLLIDPADDQAFASALLRLANDRKTCADMGRAGRDLAEKRFDAPRNFGLLVDRLLALSPATIQDRA